MIRPARYGDAARVVELLRDSRSGAGFDRQDGPSGFVFPFRPDYAERMFLRYYRAAMGATCIVHDVDGIAQGILMGHWFEHDFGPVRVAQERVWWIDPAHRGGTAAVRMLDSFEEWAAKQGCAFVGMAGMGADPDVMKLYIRRGYIPAERHCLKPLNVDNLHKNG